MKISSVTPRDKGMAKWKINNPSLLIFTLKVTLFETKSKTQEKLNQKNQTLYLFSSTLYFTKITVQILNAATLFGRVPLFLNFGYKSVSSTFP